MLITNRQFGSFDNARLKKALRKRISCGKQHGLQTPGLDSLTHGRTALQLFATNARVPDQKASTRRFNCFQQMHVCVIKRQASPRTDARGASTVCDKCTCARNQKASNPTDGRTGASTVGDTCTSLIKGEQAHVTQVPNDDAVILQQSGGAANFRTLDWA